MRACFVCEFVCVCVGVCMGVCVWLYLHIFPGCHSVNTAVCFQSGHVSQSFFPLERHGGGGAAGGGGKGRGGSEGS